MVAAIQETRRSRSRIASARCGDLQGLQLRPGVAPIGCRSYSRIKGQG
jgi:hypothetical protein